MKIKKKTIIKIVIVFSLVLYFIGKNIILWPYLYCNNYSLDCKTNNDIKELLLSVMKDNHSKIYKINKDKLYTNEYILENSRYDHSIIEKSFIIGIELNFMKHVKQISSNKYTAEVQMSFPDDWRYYFNITYYEGRYVISDIGIDP